MILEVTLVVGCPNLCVFCPQDKIIAAYGTARRMMSMGDFAACIAKLPKEVDVCFSGFSEPFLHPSCSETILWAARDHRVSLYTTTVGATRRDARLMREVDMAKLCLHLPDADENMAVRVTPEYLSVLEDFSEIPGAECMSMGRVHPSIPLTIARRAKQPKMHARAGNISRVDAPNHTSAIKCSAAPSIDHPVLLPDGRVVTCCMDYGLTGVYGNLLQLDWLSIMASPVRQSVFERQKDGDVICRRCVCAVEA